MNALKAEVDTNSTVLILGSMPGVLSLEKREYYANPNNKFWKIVCALFDIPIEEDYKQRISLLKEHGIALWDVIKHCERIGSLDSKIKNEEVNNFREFFDRYPEIRFVFFNGTKAYKVFKKHVGFGNKRLTYKMLPSTSPAHAKRFEDKLAEWREVKNMAKWR